MRNTIDNSSQSGFSLIEMALVLLLLGLVLAPAIHMYHQYRVDKDWNETEDNIDNVIVSIGGFRNVFGRYPCPASATALPGSIEYGHELADCSTTAPAAGTCNNGICTSTDPTSGEDIIIGALPFKTLNMQESESYDSSLSRLTYGVTSTLTTNTTFNINGGGISVVDKNDATLSLVAPPSSAHFIVVSHGHNKAGAFTRNGVVGDACATAPPAEQENCNTDSVFTSGDYDENNFDDRVSFFSAVMPSEWQISEPAPDAIALKNTNSVAIGSNIGQDLSAGDQMMLLRVGADTGVARTSSRIVADTLCEYNAASNADCFTPELIAGLLNDDGTTFSNGTDRLEATTTPGNGMSCYIPGGGDDFYATGIANGALQCSPEIFVNCPNGNFVGEIDGSGNVRCLDFPDDPCPAQAVTGLCGDTKTAAATYSGGHSVTFGGECRRITDYDSTYFATNLAGLNLGLMQAFINNLNNEPRTIEECNDSAANSQVRNAWLCTAGTWSANPVRTHEKNHPWSNYPSNVTSGSSPWPAENSDPTHADPNNNRWNHDCWCREDYRVRQLSCPGGLAGTRIRIEKHTCPQSSHRWTNIYQTDALCACAPGTTQTTQSCNSYYDEVNGTVGTNGLTGNVTKTFDINCVAGVPVTDPTPSSIDTSACACPVRAQIVSRSYCSTGLTNSWSWPGGNETGVETLSTRDWVCPGTTSGGLPDPGAWGPVTPYSPIPACTCDNGLTDTVVEACPAGQEGTGIVYEREWDCTLNSGAGGWEPSTDWDLIANNCKTCAWQSPGGAPSLEDFAYGSAKGSTCTCGTTPAAFCHDFAGGGKYNVWTGCPCVVQN